MTKPSDSSRRKLLGSLAALPFVSAACSTPRNQIAAPTKAPSPPGVLSGETWRYRLINRYNDLPVGEVLAEVTQVEPKLTVSLTDQNGESLGQEIYASPWQVVQEPFYNETLQFSQPVPLLPPDLAVGAQSQMTTRYSLGEDGRTRRWDSRTRAVGWERIQVPAGQFDCLRIERIAYFEPAGLSKIRARRVETLWYAPRINRWAMREWTGFFIDETTVSDKRSALPIEEREDSVRWVLLQHLAAPVAQ
ncbi:MAG: hypothetical protein AB8C46_00290 [Burkholderiaceae bacterium]